MKERAVSRQVGRRRVLYFVIFNLALLLFLALFPLYCRFMWEGGGKGSFECLTVRIFKLYCPLCGATRSLWHLIHLDLLAALTFNPFVVVLSAAVVYCDVRALISIIRGSERVLFWGKGIATGLLILLIATLVIRNILLVFFGYDPLSAVGDFWQELIPFLS